MGELLEKIPAEKRWEITAKTLWKFIILSRDKKIGPLLGVGKDIISPLWSKEKWYEITEKIFADGGKQVFPMVKDMFNIPVEDAIGAAKLFYVVGKLIMGPELTTELIEESRERVVGKTTKTCPNWDWYNECEVDPEFRPCSEAHQAMSEAGLKAVNPKLTTTLTKAIGWGDPYCEWVIEFSEE